MADEETKNLGRCLIKKSEKNYKFLLSESKEWVNVFIIVVIAVIIAVMVAIGGIFILDIIIKNLKDFFSPEILLISFFIFLLEFIVIFGSIENMGLFTGSEFKKFVNSVIHSHLKIMRGLWVTLILSSSIIPGFLLSMILVKLATTNLVIVFAIGAIIGILLSPVNVALWECLNCKKYVEDISFKHVQYWK